MKSSLAAIILLASTAATLGAAAPTKRGDSVSCTAKYRGHLHYTNLSTVSGNNTGGIITQSGNSGLQFTTNVNSAVPFHFDECRTDGWNTNDGREFGQVKANSQGDYRCLTSSDDNQHRLYFDACASSGDELLARQWFYANYQTGPNGAPAHVTLSLRGNPNDGSTVRWDLAHALAAGKDSYGLDVIRAVKPSQTRINTLNLFDVEILS